MQQNEWKPHRKQAEFIALPWTIKEALYGGGAGSAKTETLLVYPLCHKLHENPRFKQVLLRRTFPELRNEVVPRAKLLYRRFGATFNSTYMTFTFPSGAMVFLGHCENEQDVHQYDSMEISIFSPDEITSFTEWQYLYIAFTRVRSPLGSGLPAIIRGAGMPGNVGHTWVKQRFIDPYKHLGKDPYSNHKTILIGKGGIKRFYVHATSADNPYCDPDYKNSLEALPEAEKQAKKYGNWEAYLGSVFDEFRDKHYPDEPEHALHVIEPFDIPSWWPKIVAIDWGYAPPAMTWIGYGAISPEGRLYIYREQWWQKVKISDWASEARVFIDAENPRVIKMCKSAGQDRGQEHTILEQVSSALNRSVELTSNLPGSRVAGKMLFHEYLRWKTKLVPNKTVDQYNDEHALWLLRNRTQNEYNAYIDSFRELEPEDNLPKLQIFNTCTKLIEAIKLCQYDKANPQDVAEFPGDDPYDATRYLIDCADRYINDSQSEFAKVQKRKQLEEQLVVSGDMTAFYRNSRRLENENLPRAMRRYAHR